MKLVLASQNPHKIRELRSVLPEHWELLTPTDLGIAGELLEEGVTLYENAQQKAEFLWRACGLPSLADDSGLEVDFLDGMPGVEGEITKEERGSQGFGYDSLFVPSEGDGRTFAEMQEGEKSLISHRSRAVAAWLKALQKS